MTIDERHRRLQRKLEEVLGNEEAGTLMDDLGRGRLDVELRRCGRDDDLAAQIGLRARTITLVATVA